MFIPEHDDLQALMYRIASQVSATFTYAETRLLAEIARRLARELPDMPTLSEQLAVVRELQQFASTLTAGITQEWAFDIVARAARDGAASVTRFPSWASMPAVPYQHAMAASLIAWDLGNKFEDMRARILRYPRDVMGNYITGGDIYQQVIADHVAQIPLGASTAATRKAALTDFLERGVTGFTDIAGRNWRIGTYVETATRTAVSRAYLDAKIFTAAEVGIDLFSILGGANACAKCAPWFGKIIATSGTSGPRQVPHAFEDRTVTVHVAGTFEDWRESGANHPNCACVPVEFAPGFNIPTSASGYDPAAHAARDRLRELEVMVRDAKRKMLIAEASGDLEKVERQRRRIRSLQAKIRDHVETTGQRRRYEREQIKWADG